MNIKKWEVSSLNKENAVAIAEKYNIPFFLAMLLEIRGMREEDQIMAFFNNDATFFNPLLMADMKKAVDRIHRAIDDFEKIAVYGDYDADGVTSTAMLYSYLESCGANVMFYIPEREEEGYGLNLGAIDTLNEQQVKLIVTVDNGIASINEVDYANTLGIDVVVTDHHRPREVIPSAVAVIDPFRKDCPSPFKYFSGVGVAFKLITALEGEDCDSSALLENYADLVAIGTIGDVVPLSGENRTLVKIGLNHISRTDRLGLKCLLQKASMEGRKLTATNVAFTIVPRINATGRIASPDKAVELLICDDPEQAEELATDICENNEYRRQIENELFEQAIEFLKNHPQILYDRVIVVEGENWHAGVIGIVASRLTERFGKPCIVISYSADEAKGSGRSIEGFSLFEAICSCAEYFIKFGGHPMAAGFSLKTENISAFRTAINQYAALQGTMPPQVLSLDCKLNPAALNIEMVKNMELLEPFGMGNPSPLFGLYNMKLDEIVPVGGGKHLRLVLSKNQSKVTCMLFGVTPEEFSYQLGNILDLAVTLECKPYRGEEFLSVFVKECRLSNMDTDNLIQNKNLYEKIKRNDPILEEERIAASPNHDDFAVIYRFLRANTGWNDSPIVLLFRLNSSSINLAKLLIALDIMAERGLITLNIDGNTLHITLNSVEKKVDLSQSPILIGLNNLQRNSE